MNLIIEIFCQEFWLGIKSRGYWVLLVLANGLLLYTLYIYQMFEIRITEFFFMFFIFWNIGILARDWSKGTSEIMEAFPCRGWELLLGRAAANFSLLMLLGGELFFFVILDMFFIFPGSLPFYDLLWNYWLNFFLISINSIGVILFIEAGCRSTFLRVLALLVLCLLAVFDGDGATAFPYWIPPLNPGVDLAAAASPSQLTGTYPHNGFLPFVLCQQVGASGSMFIISSYFYGRKAYNRKNKIFHIVLLFIALLMFWAGSVFLSGFYERNNATYQAAFAAAQMDGEQAENIVDVQLLRYQIAVNLKTAINSAECQSHIFFKNTSCQEKQKIYITLKAYYEIEKMTDGKGKEIVWLRKGDFVEAELNEPLAPEAVGEINIDYRGHVDEWFTDYDAEPRGPINFIAKEMVLLRPGHAWYPVLGKKQVYAIKKYQKKLSGQTIPILTACNVSHEAVPFSLVVQMDQDMEIITGLPLQETVSLADGRGRKSTFFSPAGRDVFLLTAPYKENIGEDCMISIYCADRHLIKANSVRSLVKEQHDFYEQWIPLPEKAVHVVELPQFLLNTWMGGTVERKRICLPNTVALSEYYFRSMPWQNTSEMEAQQMYFEEAVLSLWWPEFNTSGFGNISAGMMSYMHTLYKENVLGQEYYALEKQFWQNYEPEDSADFSAGIDKDRSHVGGENLTVKEVFLLLDRIRQSEAGLEGTKDFMRKVHAATLADGELDWIELKQLINDFEQELLEKGCSSQQVHMLTANAKQTVDHMEELKRAALPPQSFILKIR
jgi:hypothetical protein